MRPPPLALLRASSPVWSSPRRSPDGSSFHARSVSSYRRWSKGSTHRALRRLLRRQTDRDGHRPSHGTPKPKPVRLPLSNKPDPIAASRRVPLRARHKGQTRTRRRLLNVGGCGVLSLSLGCATPIGARAYSQSPFVRATCVVQPRKSAKIASPTRQRRSLQHPTKANPAHVDQ